MMGLLTIILTVVGIAYLLIVITMMLGVRFSRMRDLRDREDRPFVSVLVPARDEENTLRACLESLAEQTYPGDRYEIILVNDHSTDATGEIAADVASKVPNIHIVVPGESSHLTGRSNALAYGIDTARGEVFLMTDADCVIPPTWVEETTKRFRKDVGVVGGLTVQRATRILEGMQTLDWMFLLGIAASTVGLRLPLSIIGNNFSISRAAYDDVGGFRSIKNSVTEDFQLFKAVVNTGRWGFKFMLDPKTTNVTRACQTVAEIIEQKHRWGRGGLDLNWLGYTLVVTGFLMHAALVLGFIVSPALALPWLGAKLVADALFLGYVGRSVGRFRDLLYLPWFEVYFFLYVLLMPLRVLSSKNVAWKGRTYGADHQPLE